MKRIGLGTAAVAALALSACGGGSVIPGGGSMDITGTWMSEEKGDPHLTFGEDDSYTGSDGCNGLWGDYSVDGGTITLEPKTSTLKACVGVNTWLFNAKSIEASSDELTVFDKDGKEIGTLTRGEPSATPTAG